MPSIQQIVSAALLDGSSRVTRRAEIYEADATTIFADSNTVPRIIDGSVTVDMSRDERRSLDITFDNSDGVLRHDPNGFWYDKIIKVYRGTEWNNSNPIPSIAIITTPGTVLTKGLRKLGFTDLYSVSAVTYGDIDPYDIIIADGGTTALSAEIYTLLTDAYNAGKSVLTISDEADQTLNPLITATTTKSDAAGWGMTPATTDNPLGGRWAAFTTGGTATGKVISGYAASATRLATYVWSSTTYTVALSAVNTSSGGRWVHLQEEYFDVAGYNQFMVAIINWLYTSYGQQSWETQIGEFMIDRINEPRFPSIIKCTGRDYTKKLLKSKFSVPLTFSDGTSIDTVIGAIAANGGVTKQNLNAEGAVLDGSLSFDRTTERWAAIRGLAETASVEVYFDANGYLTTRPMRDPSLSPASLLLATGADYGNLVDWEKSSNDSRLYNRVIITSTNDGVTSSIDNGLQVIVANTEPSSPTRVAKIGERDYFYTSSFFTNEAQMQSYGEKLLKIVALEEYSLDFTVVPFYWTEAGDILDFEDPDSGVDEPTRFLLSNFSIPLALGTMTGTGKRVTIVGQAT